METKQRNSKKKSPPIELPQSVLDQYSRIENLLRNSSSRKWLHYEFEYDAVENAFFKQNQTKIIESILSRKLPQLKSRKLTMAEWSKIRKLVFGQKTRRFSSKFVQEQRIDLEKYRRCYNVLRENQRDDQLSKLNGVVSTNKGIILCDERPKYDIYRLIVEIKKQFSSKSATVAELREINSAKTEGRTIGEGESNAYVTKTVAKLLDYNEAIMKGFRKMLHFQIAKDALMFNSLSREKLFLALSPVYFQRKCAVQIYEEQQEYRVNTFVESDHLMQLMNILQELILAFTEYQLLATNNEDYLKAVLKRHDSTMKSILVADNYEYFNADILPLFLNIVKKVHG